MKLHLFYVRTGHSRSQVPPPARTALLRAGWQRVCPNRPFPVAGFSRTPQGRPHVPGEAFNCSLAHADGLSVLACAPCGRVGVDAASAPDAALAAQLDASFFTPAERQALAQRRYSPLQLWTRKEAALKAAGTGLLLAPAHAGVTDATLLLQGHKYWLHSTTFSGGYELALATDWAFAPPEAAEWTEVFWK